MTTQEAIRVLRAMQQSTGAIARAVADERGQYFPREAILDAVRLATAALSTSEHREREERRAIEAWNRKALQ